MYEHFTTKEDLINVENRLNQRIDKLENKIIKIEDRIDKLEIKVESGFKLILDTLACNGMK